MCRPLHLTVHFHSRRGWKRIEAQSRVRGRDPFNPSDFAYLDEDPLNDRCKLSINTTYIKFRPLSFPFVGQEVWNNICM